MATQLATQKATLAGLNSSFAAADATGNTFTNTGEETVRVKTGGTPVSVVVTGVGPCNHGVVHNSAAIVVPANQEREIGPFRDLKRWNNAQGRTTLTFDQVVGVTLAVVSQ